MKALDMTANPPCANLYYYQGANPTVDLALVSPQYKILLILRGDHLDTCPGQWAIPGGFVDTAASRGEAWRPGLETPERAAWRELVEETAIEAHRLDPTRLQFNAIYEGNQRDPRDNAVAWAKSHSFYYVMTEDEKSVVDTVKGIKDGVDLDDAQDTRWFTLEEISHMSLAFDHNRIINDIAQCLAAQPHTQHSAQKKTSKP